MRNNIVILGGGGGSSSLLKSLNILLNEQKISTITSILGNVDDGGSTGILRNQYDTSSWGDITKNILALVDIKEDDYFAQSLQCRINTGFLKGHTLRNIIAFGMSYLKNCDDQCAIDNLCKILKINSKITIVPITKEPCVLRIRGYSPNKSKKIIYGQKTIATELPILKMKEFNQYIIDVVTQNHNLAKINPLAKKKIS